MKLGRPGSWAKSFLTKSGNAKEFDFDHNNPRRGRGRKKYQERNRRVNVEWVVRMFKGE